MRILITGASGLIGSALTTSLAGAGHQVVRAVRRPPQDPQQEIRWSPAGGEIDRTQLGGIDAVVHLAGANIAGHRWTERYKREILESRVQGTRLISEGIAALETKAAVLVCASAIGYYGDRGPAELEESSAPGEGFLPEVCLQWERACEPARSAGIRTVNTRIGVVLSPEGGALKTMLTPFKLGAGGVMGSGRQYLSWIALDDVVAAIQFVLANNSVSGPVNLVSPHPVTNREFTKALGRVLHRPAVFPMPAFAARLAFGEMADELLLSSTRVSPKILLDKGFEFRFPELEKALRHLLTSP